VLCRFCRTKIDGRRNRYNPGEVSTLIIAHVDSLADAGLIDRRRGGVHPDTQQRALTRIRPDLDLLAMFEALPVSVRQSVALHPSAEFIILRDSDKNDINYIDTDETRAMRRRLVGYNLLLDRTFIDIPSLGHPPFIVTQNKARRGRQPSTRRVTVSQSSKRVYRNRLMNIDGRITDIIIDTLTQMGIPALSVHDSYIVARQHEGLLRQTMESAYQQVTGMDKVMIDRKDVGQDQSMTIDYERRYRSFLEG
jgi:hypothetical protein